MMKRLMILNVILVLALLSTWSSAWAYDPTKLEVRTLQRWLWNYKAYEGPVNGKITPELVEAIKTTIVGQIEGNDLTAAQWKRAISWSKLIEATFLSNAYMQYALDLRRMILSQPSEVAVNYASTIEKFRSNVGLDTPSRSQSVLTQVLMGGVGLPLVALDRKERDVIVFNPILDLILIFHWDDGQAELPSPPNNLELVPGELLRAEVLRLDAVVPHWMLSKKPQSELAESGAKLAQAIYALYKTDNFNGLYLFLKQRKSQNAINATLGRIVFSAQGAINAGLACGAEMDEFATSLQAIRMQFRVANDLSGSFSSVDEGGAFPLIGFHSPETVKVYGFKGATSLFALVTMVKSPTGCEKGSAVFIDALEGVPYRAGDIVK